MFPLNDEQAKKVSDFLALQRKNITRQQWSEAYQSWAHGGHGWNKLRSGGTDIQTCLAWYQFIHKPGSREWRPSIIINAVCYAAGLAAPNTASTRQVAGLSAADNLSKPAATCGLC